MIHLHLKSEVKIYIWKLIKIIDGENYSKFIKYIKTNKINEYIVDRIKNQGRRAVDCFHMAEISGVFSMPLMMMGSGLANLFGWYLCKILIDKG